MMPEHCKTETLRSRSTTTARSKVDSRILTSHYKVKPLSIDVTMFRAVINHVKHLSFLQKATKATQNKNEEKTFFLSSVPIVAVCDPLSVIAVKA